MKPLFQNCNAICFACDSNYIKQTYVSVMSIVNHAVEDETYEIVILETGISEYQKKEFYLLETDNIKISFFDMQVLVDTKGISNFFISRYITIASYFRIFIPEIFSNYNKVLYLDSDIIVCENIAPLWEVDLAQYLLGVVPDISRYIFKLERATYIEKQLRMSCENYFCAGVILYNIKAVRAFNLTEKCCELLGKIPKPMFHDQDILNAVTNGKNKELPTKWHFMSWIMTYNNLTRLKEKTPSAIYKDFIQTSKDFNIIHFGGRRKPWQQASLPFAQYWWNIARRTPFYESFLFEMQQLQIDSSLKSLGVNIKNTYSLKLKRCFYRLLCKITFGDYKEKKLQRLHRIEEILKRLNS